AHADRRVRLEAQLELAARGDVASLEQVARNSADRLGRIHAIWGLGQVARSRGEVAPLQTVAALLDDADDELRAQAANIVGRSAWAPATGRLTRLLADDSLRVRYFAAQGLAKIGDSSAVAAIAEMLAENDN